MLIVCSMGKCGSYFLSDFSCFTVERERQEQQREVEWVLQDCYTVGWWSTAVKPKRQGRLLWASTFFPCWIFFSSERCNTEIGQNDKKSQKLVNSMTAIKLSCISVLQWNDICAIRSYFTCIQLIVALLSCIFYWTKKIVSWSNYCERVIQF